MKGNEIGSLLKVGTARMKEDITLCVNGAPNGSVVVVIAIVIVFE
jgi:hypothetical protein